MSYEKKGFGVIVKVREEGLSREGTGEISRREKLGRVVQDDGEVSSDEVSFLGQSVVKCHPLKRLKPGAGTMCRQVY